MLLSLLYMSEKKCTFAAANLARNSEKQTEDIDTKKEPLRTLRRDDKIRTCDLRSPRPLRYRTAPHPDALKIISSKAAAKVLLFFDMTK